MVKQTNIFLDSDFEEVQITPKPVTCLGMTFESDEARRAYFREELRKKLPELRKIEGSPIGEDDDIINLSDPPYYTACPNPWLNDFIELWEKEKVELEMQGKRNYCDLVKQPYAYGVTVNLYGVATGVNDKEGADGAGIYLNGSVKHNDNAPVINIYKSAKITGTGLGIYAAGFATWNIEDGASIEGKTGIEIRAGILNVKGGTIVGTGKELVSKPNGDGSTTEGAGIAIVQHTTKNTIKVTVTKGLIEGYTAFYQNNTEKLDEASVAKIKLAINGGTFNAINGGKNAVYSENKTNFVTKGTFNAEVDKAYLAETATLEQSGNNYVVKPNVEVESDGVKFESDDAFSNEYTLVVTPKSEEEVKDVTTKLTEAYKNNTKVKGLKLISLHDISMYLDNAVVPMENGKYTISIPVAENLRNFKNYKVIYVNEDGEIQETIDAKLVNGKVVFTTTHLSTYGVIGYNNPTTNPETSDNIVTYAVILCASIFALGSAVTLRKRYN